MAARTAAPAAPKTRTRKPKAEAAPAPVAAEMSPKEKEPADRYPHQSIVPGSYRVSGGREGWGTKHTVLIQCRYPGGCTNERVLATSDLQWELTAFCVGCAKLLRANRRATKAEKKKLK